MDSISPDETAWSSFGKSRLKIPWGENRVEKTRDREKARKLPMREGGRAWDRCVQRRLPPRWGVHLQKRLSRRASAQFVGSVEPRLFEST
jgi:hypothetical protein